MPTFPLHRGGSGFQEGFGNRNEPTLNYAPVPATVTSTATLTAEQVVAGMIVANPSTTAATYTLPTAVLIDAALPSTVVGHTFDLFIVNIGTSTGTVTLAMGAGVTDGGNAAIVNPVQSSSHFRFRKTAVAGAWVVYKIA